MNLINGHKNSTLSHSHSHSRMRQAALISLNLNITFILSGLLTCLMGLTGCQNQGMADADPDRSEFETDGPRLSSELTGGFTRRGLPYTAASDDGEIEKLKQLITDAQLANTKLSRSVLAAEVKRLDRDGKQTQKAPERLHIRVHVSSSDSAGASTASSLDFDVPLSMQGAEQNAERDTIDGAKSIAFEQIPARQAPEFKLRGQCATPVCDKVTLFLRKTEPHPALPQTHPQSAPQTSQRPQSQSQSQSQSQTPSQSRGDPRVTKRDFAETALIVRTRRAEISVRAIKDSDTKSNVDSRLVELVNEYQKPREVILRTTEVAWGISAFSMVIPLSKRDHLLCIRGYLVQTNDADSKLWARCSKTEESTINANLVGNTNAGDLIMHLQEGEDEVFLTVLANRDPISPSSQRTTPPAIQPAIPQTTKFVTSQATRLAPSHTAWPVTPQETQLTASHTAQLVTQPQPQPSQFEAGSNHGTDDATGNKVANKDNGRVGSNGDKIVESVHAEKIRANVDTGAYTGAYTDDYADTSVETYIDIVNDTNPNPEVISSDHLSIPEVDPTTAAPAPRAAPPVSKAASTVPQPSDLATEPAPSAEPAPQPPPSSESSGPSSGLRLPSDPDHPVTRAFENDREHPVVAEWIAHWHTKRAERMRQFIARIQPNLPVMSEALRASDVPPEFITITLIESEFFVEPGYPIGVAKLSTATGPWQFVAKTAKGLGLSVRAFLDKRRANPCDERALLAPSSRAAGQYFRQLLDMFPHDPKLAVLSYNWGQGNVQKALLGLGKNKKTRLANIKRGGFDFWTVRKFNMANSGAIKYVLNFLGGQFVARDPELYGITPHDPEKIGATKPAPGSCG